MVNTKAMNDFWQIAVLGVALLTVGVAMAWSSKPGMKNSEDKAPEPVVKKPKLISILNVLAVQMNHLMVQLAKLEASLRGEMARTGRQDTEQELAAFLMAQFEQNMTKVEAQIYRDVGVTEDQVKEAQEYYMDDPDVKQAVRKIKSCFAMISGKESESPLDDVHVPSHLTIDKVLSILKDTLEGMSAVMDQVCEEIQEETGLDHEALQVVFHERYVKRVDRLSADVCDRNNVTQDELQKAVMQYSSDPHFKVEVEQLQRAQAQRFQAAAENLREVAGIELM